MMLESFGMDPMFFLELNRNGNDVETGKPPRASSRPFNGLLEKRRDFILFAEYSFIVTGSKNGAEPSKINF